MTTLQFATCCPRTALEHIQRYYDVVEEDIPELLELIRQDKARVTDPDFHTQCMVVVGQKGTEEDIPIIREACSPLLGKEKGNAEGG
jgi:hypothetical protein